MGRLARSTLPQNVELIVTEARRAEVVIADRGQIQQIVLNLIINAADSMTELGSSLRVEVGRSELDAEAASQLEPPQMREAGSYCFVRVVDQGVGMTPETRKHIFDPFFSTKPNGQGLGLAAALGIARVLGGGFDVWSEPSRGSRFTLYLPTSAAEVLAVERPKLGKKLTQAPRVLVIDDQDAVREMVLAVLVGCGYRACPATGGREAVALLQSEPEEFALAIVDMSMPDMDGEAPFHALRTIRADLPVLLSSGFDAHETAARLAGTEGVSFLPKPYRLSELQARVEALITPLL